MAAADMAPRVVVTGASQGIGKAILLNLARGGQFVLGVSRSKPAEMENPGASPESGCLDWKPLDLSNGAAVAQFAASLEPIPVRGLVLSAVDYGANQRHPVPETSPEEWQRVISTNCTGQCILVSQLLPKLAAHSPGILVHISSDTAILPGAGRAAYATSKAGLHAMLRAVAAEYPTERLLVYQLIPTFQSVTAGLRRRRPVGFDFSSYADPDLLAQVVRRIVTPSGSPVEPGAYLVRRDGTLDAYPEITQI